MGVNVDEARRDQQPRRVDLVAAGGSDAADGSDAVAVDRDVAGEGGAPAAVDDGAAADDKIMHRRLSQRLNRRLSFAGVAA